MGQTVVEDVSAEARLARGINGQATKVIVWHPENISKEEVHSQVNAIVSVRSRSELLRMVGSIALFPVGVVIDHSVLLAVPAPVGSGYSSYKAYIHYKGTRGSWRLQHLIKDYEHKSKINPGKSEGRERIGRQSLPGGDQGMKEGGYQAMKVGEQFGTLGRSVMESSCLLGSSEESNDSGVLDLSPKECIGERRISNDGLVGCDGPIETGSFAGSPSVPETQGLEYRVMPHLSRFVSALLAHPGEVLPEGLAVELCRELPSTHGAEVARHIAELRRRHDRQQRSKAQQAKAGGAFRGAQQELAELPRRSENGAFLTAAGSESVKVQQQQVEVEGEESASPDPSPAGPQSGASFVDPLSR